MQYALLIYGEERDEPDARRPAAAGRCVALQPVGSATTVRVRDGETLVGDGPFAETREVLGGFCLVEADTLDEAIDWASRIPGAGTGTVEVRPVADLSGEAA